MASPNSFRKHGTFIYQVSETIADYGSTQLVIEAMQKAGMTHAWVRIHGPTPYGTGTKKIIADFIAALNAASIGVAAWGWCDGSDPTANAKLALKELSFFGLTDYIADIEHGVHGANWTPNEITKFCTLARAGITGGFGITTFPLIDWHEPELMEAALPFVDMFNPQVYWHHFPNKKMLKQFKRPNGTSYTANDAAECRAHAAEKAHRLNAVTDDHPAGDESFEPHAVDFISGQTGQFWCVGHVSIVRYSGLAVDARPQTCERHVCGFWTMRDKGGCSSVNSGWPSYCRRSSVSSAKYAIKVRVCAPIRWWDSAPRSSC